MTKEKLKFIREILVEMNKNKHLSTQEQKDLIEKYISERIEEYADIYKSTKTGLNWLQREYYSRLSSLLARNMISFKLEPGYEELRKNYYQFLQVYKSLFDELKITDSLDIANLFYFMYYKGYFSIDKDKIPDDKISFDIAIKKAVPFIETIACNNNMVWRPQMLNDIEGLFGINAKLCHCDIDKYHPVNKQLLIVYILLGRLPLNDSYFVSYVDDGKKHFIINPTSRAIYNLGTKSSDLSTIPLSKIFNLGNLVLSHYPFCDSYDDTFLAFPNSIERGSITVEQDYDSLKKALKIMEEEKDMLNDAYHDVHPLMVELLNGANEKQNILIKSK